jgi:FkbM family methyltransferase
MLKTHEKGNISVTDEFLSYLHYFYEHINKTKSLNYFLLYRKAYLNYFSVVLHILLKKYPFQGILKNSGHNILLRNDLEAYNLAHTQIGHNGLEYDVKKDTIIVSRTHITSRTEKNSNYNNNEAAVRLYDAIGNGDIVDIFVNDMYGDLPVKGKMVIDIGANIGDSAIYFALRGASKIVGIEPYPRSYNIAKQNIELNNLSDKVTLLLAASGANNGYINVDPEYKSDINSPLIEFRQQEGVRVRVMTLDTILNENKISYRDAILKIDCEGCEYETLLSTPDSTLQRFSHISLEYHYGYKNLKEKLERSGFNTTITRPIMPEDNTKMRLGFIFAIRN